MSRRQSRLPTCRFVNAVCLVRSSRFPFSENRKPLLVATCLGFSHCCQVTLLGFEIEQVVILIAMPVHLLETDQFDPAMIGAVLAEQVMPDLFSVLLRLAGGTPSLRQAERQGARERMISYDRKPYVSCIP